MLLLQFESGEQTKRYVSMSEISRIVRLSDSRRLVIGGSLGPCEWRTCAVFRPGVWIESTLFISQPGMRTCEVFQDAFLKKSPRMTIFYHNCLQRFLRSNSFFVLPANLIWPGFVYVTMDKVRQVSKRSDQFRGAFVSRSTKSNVIAYFPDLFSQLLWDTNHILDLGDDSLPQSNSSCVTVVITSRY